MSDAHGLLRLHATWAVAAHVAARRGRGRGLALAANPPAVLFAFCPAVLRSARSAGSDSSYGDLGTAPASRLPPLGDGNGGRPFDWPCNPRTQRSRSGAGGLVSELEGLRWRRAQLDPNSAARREFGMLLTRYGNPLDAAPNQKRYSKPSLPSARFSSARRTRGYGPNSSLVPERLSSTSAKQLGRSPGRTGLAQHFHYFGRTVTHVPT